jgi:hypothetical protein
MNEQVVAGGLSNQVELSVDLEGMTLRVGAGDFRIAGEDYSLAEEQTYEVEGSTSEVTWVSAYLVQDVSDDSVVLLVDERPDGDRPYFFGAASPYRLLHSLACAKIWPGTTNLDNAEVTVWKVVAGDNQPEEPQE